MLQALSNLLRKEQGSVAPTVALSLVGLVAAGGLAFDFARMAAMDTELQNAADQAALAAATQLDGETGARARAQAAASGLLNNRTLFADGSRAINNLTFTFYTSYDGTADTYGPVASTDASAKVVQVTIGQRTVAYALTPIAGLLRGSTTAEAVAGLGTAVCKAPPLMICNPNSAGDPTFSSNYTGRGFLLVARNNEHDTYGPGNFGFLDTGYDTTGGGAAELRRALGQANFVQECARGDLVTTNPGASSPALDAINTRFDIFSNNVQQASVCGNGQCPPASNVRKDLMRDAPGGGGGSGVIGRFCKETNDPNPDNDNSGNPKGWLLPADSGRYLPSSNAELTAGQRADLLPMGLPRDICHAFDPVNGCGSVAGGRLGTGVWDRAAYFQSHYGASFSWQTTPGLGPNVTRYQTYLWEIANKDRNPGGINRNVNVPRGGTFHGAPVCQTQGVSDPVGDIDRRRLTVAVVNCTGSSPRGRDTLAPAKWIDIFLVEPSFDRPAPSGASPRTTKNDLYIEMIGESRITGPGGQTHQVERSVPYLIR
jgi:Flp pilus assembly protein TadG